MRGAGAYVVRAGGGIGEDAMEAGYGLNKPGRHELEDAEAERAWPKCWPLTKVYFKKMRGVRTGRPTKKRAGGGSAEPARSAVYETHRTSSLARGRQLLDMTLRRHMLT